MSLWQRVVAANRPGPPEDSRSFRAASTAAVAIGLAACWSQQELPTVVAVGAVAATVVGNVLSYRRRRNPWPLVKPVLALCAVGGFTWFIVTVTRTAAPGDISTVEGPLAVLFAWVLCTHAFDVPARRDVAYSLAGSGALMAVAAAQSVDLVLGAYVVAWVATGLWGLVAMWQSMSGTRTFPWLTLAAGGLAVLVVAGALVVVLPAPQVSTSMIFPASSAGSSPVDSPTNLTDGAGSLPAHAASPTGRTRVGGYLGFARSLDTASRTDLGDQVVMRVRASRPGYWVGQTYDQWNGQSWAEAGSPTSGRSLIRLETGSPFSIPVPPGDQGVPATGNADIQTFYLAQSGPNLVFHSGDAVRVYLESRALFVTGDGTIVSAATMGAGTVYTVVSADTAATAAQLRSAGNTTPDGAGPVPGSPGPGAAGGRYLQLPHPYPRVAALARHVTAGSAPAGGAGTVYDRVEAVERWMSTHITYSTDIPPLAPGADAVTSFLFGSRVGYCEQISTATVVMLRSLGIPAREAVGYVPGSYNPITDLYQVQAKDAHAWVQVWFPRFGWQNFDPTANVPLANPSPGSVLVGAAGRRLAHLPWIPLGLVAAVVVAAFALRRRRLHRPPTWAHRVARDLDGGARRLGLPRHRSETLAAFGERLERADPVRAAGLAEVTRLAEESVFGGIEPSADQIAAATERTRRFRTGHPPGNTGDGSGDGGDGDQERSRARASSKEAPAATNGR